MPFLLGWRPTQNALQLLLRVMLACLETCCACWSKSSDDITTLVRLLAHFTVVLHVMIFRQGRGGVKFEDVIGIFGCMRHCILVWIVLSRRWVRVALQFPGSTSSGDRIVVYEMANSQEVDLMSVGQHCSLESCHRLDLLPFTCSKCHQFYCSDHRKPGDHQCPVKDEVDVRVPVCPLCNQPIIKSKHQDVNVQVGVSLSLSILSGCLPVRDWHKIWLIPAYYNSMITCRWSIT
jgi:hypothetical protein